MIPFALRVLTVSSSSFTMSIITLPCSLFTLHHFVGPRAAQVAAGRARSGRCGLH